MIRLRQIVLVARNLEPVNSQLFQLLGISCGFNDPDDQGMGLINSVMAIGDTYLEVIAPTRDDTPAGRTAHRVLERRGGDGGYMVMAQVDDIQAVSDRIDRLNIRKAWEIDREDVTAFHVHPRDIGAAIVSFDEMRPQSEWTWAGPGWRERRAKHVSGISAVEVQSAEPAALAEQWSRAFDRPIVADQGMLVMKLDEGEVRFHEDRDGRGDGVSGVEFQVHDWSGLEQSRKAAGLEWQDDCITICGTSLRFKEQV